MDWREARISAGVGPGWEPLVDELHAKVLALAPDVSVDQVKEKFGGLRYYISGAPIRIDFVSTGESFVLAKEVEADSPWAKVEDLVKEYEARSFKTCEWCGTTENVTTSTGAPGRWLKTLCPTHRQAWDEERRWWQEGAT